MSVAVAVSGEAMARAARRGAPRGFELSVCEMDFRPGGAYRFVSRRPVGVENYVHVVMPMFVQW